MYNMMAIVNIAIYIYMYINVGESKSKVFSSQEKILFYLYEKTDVN